jgi:hypothetical protein
MPGKRLSMRKIREALRLKAAGFAKREIATSIGAGKSTVYEMLARAEALGLTWPLPDDLNDERLEEMLYPPPSAELVSRRPVPDWRAVQRELKRRDHHVTLRLIWLEWKEQCPDGYGSSYVKVFWGKVPHAARATGDRSVSPAPRTSAL